MSANGNTTALVQQDTQVAPGAEFLPIMDLAVAKNRRDQLVAFASQILVEGVDYDTQHGKAERVLKKPGAEKLQTFFGLTPELKIQEEVKDWTGKDHNGEPFFLFDYVYHLKRGDKIIGIGIGSCNSWESKYRFRWVAESLLDGEVTYGKRGGTFTEPEFAINKAETSGKYGKPAEYWALFDEAIRTGKAKKGQREKRDTKGEFYTTWTIESWEYRVLNVDVFDLVNTIQKMAKKRAFVDAVLNGTGASEFYTQDLEEDHKFADPNPSNGSASPAGNGATSDTNNGGGSADTTSDPPELVNLLNCCLVDGELELGAMRDVFLRARQHIVSITDSDKDFQKIIGEIGMKDASDLAGKKTKELANTIRKLWWFATNYQPDSPATKDEINPEDFHEEPQVTNGNSKPKQATLAGVGDDS